MGSPRSVDLVTRLATFCTASCVRTGLGDPIAGAILAVPSRMPTIRQLTLLGCLFTVAATGCTDGQDESAGGDRIRPGGKADDAFASGPMVITGAFDGSQRFAMWVDTLKFARTVKDSAQRQL